MLREAAQKYKSKTALTMGNQRLSFAELDQASNKMANALVGLGVNKGDRVAMLLSNSPEFVISYFGVVKCGAIAVPLDTKYKLTELKALFADCQPNILISEDPYLAPVAVALPQLSSIKYVIEVSCNGEGRAESYRNIMATASAEDIDIALSPDDVAHIAYTSGSSLFPKGVMLTHGGLVAEAEISGDGFQQTERDKVVLFALPLHHAFGLVVVVLTSLVKGSEVIILPGLSISGLMEIIERERVTMFMAVPFVHALVVNQAEEKGISHDLSSLRLCGSAGAALPQDIAHRFQKCFGLKIIDFWGQTEASAHVTCQSLNGNVRAGSVGKVLPGWELKVVDNNGKELVIGQRGELVVRGPIMKGIYNNPQITSSVIRDGWLHTGDIGELDAEGNVYLFGNNKGMFIVKGQNIFPGDIEAILKAHPSIAEVVVVGVPDDIRGSIVRAAIRVKKGEIVTEQEIKHLCMEHLANYKVPKQVVFVDAFPRTADGKIDREAIKRMTVVSSQKEG